MGNFYTDTIKKDPRFSSINSCNDMGLLEPNFRLKIQKIIEDAHNNGHDLRVMETFRSQARQVYLYKQGFTQLKTVGVHNYGLACDFGLFTDGKYEEDGQKYTFLRDYEKKYQVISGQLWGTPWQKHSFFDAGHLQDIPVFRQGSLFNGSWYPDDKYDPIKDTLVHYGPVAAKYYG